MRDAAFRVEHRLVYATATILLLDVSVVLIYVSLKLSGLQHFILG